MFLRQADKATASLAGYDREWRADPRRSGGGELIDQGVHLIDLVRLVSWRFSRGGKFRRDLLLGHESRRQRVPPPADRRWPDRVG